MGVILVLLCVTYGILSAWRPTCARIPQKTYVNGWSSNHTPTCHSCQEHLNLNKGGRLAVATSEA